MKKKLLRSFLIIFASSLLLASTQVSSNNRYFEIAQSIEIYADLFKELNRYYVDEINPNDLMKVGLDAMLKSLDPYTNYIPQELIEEYRLRENRQYTGLGAESVFREGSVIITMVSENSAAFAGGLKIGDVIREVDGVSVEGLKEFEIYKLIDGQLDTPIEVTVDRFGQSDPITLNFLRDRIDRNSVPVYEMLEGGIGYVKLTEFKMRSGLQVKQRVDTLLTKQPKGLILDLRGNPGGYLNESVNIVNIFIDKGMEVVTTRGKLVEDNTTWTTRSNPLNDSIPLVVLINSGSASASEIVSGTLQDYDRAVILGKKSFGKGLVQDTKPLSYKSQLKVTIAKYYTPSGRCIQALDYSNRNPDGSVGKVPDSLKRRFRTRAGRVVYDGGGVDPDVSIEEKKDAPIIKGLKEKGYIFDYATRYFYSNEEIAEPTQFKLTDSELDDFISWVRSSDFDYSTTLEKEIEKLKESATEEKYLESIAGRIQELEAGLAKSKENDFDAYREDIRNALELEIVGRYYYVAGQVESTLFEDDYIIEAQKILNDRQRYNSILRIQ